MMRKIFTLFAVVLIVASVFAQVPQKMSYQAVIRNSNKVLVTNQKINMMISILQGQTPVYVEMQTTTTNDNGLATIEIGNGTALSGVFSKIDWGNGEHYIKTETDPTGGTNYTIVGTSQLLSVPYALYATTTGSTTGGSSVTLDDSTISTTKGWSSFKINEELGLKANTSSLATVAISGKFSDLIGKPTTLAGYGITDGGPIAKKMSGDATMDTDGVVTISNNAITSPKIMDGSIANVDLDKANIPLSGFGLPTAAISMGGFKLTNVATPTNNKDAANKKYVDDAILAGASPVLSLDASQNLSVKGGNSVSLADLYQSLSLAGTVLSISGPRDSHVDLAGILAGIGGSGSGTGIVIHDATLTGNGITASPLGISSQGITPLKLAGISTNGTSGQVLTSDGNGNFVWANAGSGGGSGLTAITPYGGITSSIAGTTASIGINDGAIFLTKIAPISGMSIIGNKTGSTAFPIALQMSDVKSMLVLTKSDVGLGNVQNVDQTNADNLTSGSISTARFANSTIPVSAIIGSGNAATYLRGDGTWGTISGGTGTQTAAQVTNNGIAGVTGTNVQATLEGLKALIDTKATTTTLPSGGGATHTKITYDSNGLVTAGADATTADIADSSNKRYVTDSQLTALSGISGTNTGDQSAANVPVTPTGALVSTNVQAALVELQGKITTAASGGMVGVNHDATLTGDGNTTNLGLADGAVTFAKMANLAAKSLIGNSASASAKPEAITIGSGLTLSSGVLSAGGTTAGATGGDVTISGQNYLSLSGQSITANPVDLSGTNAIGTLAAGRFPALTGDVTTTAGSLVTTLSGTGIASGTYTSVTVDTKGRVISGNNYNTLGAGLTDVDVSTKSAGEVLQWDGSKWINKAVSAGNQSITFTPNATGDVTGTATGTTSLTPTLTIGAGKVTNSMLATGIDAAKLTGILPLSTIPTTLTGITSINGMTISTTPTFALSDGSKTLTVTGNAAVSGTNTGDQTAAAVILAPATISGISGGTVQAALTDIGSKLTQNTSNIANKLDANSAITANSNYSIVKYDTKGLVTGGKIPSTDDISDAASSTNKYVTPAQLTVLGNTTGTNTGDQTLSVSSGKLKISAGNSVDVVTSLTAGSGLTGTGTTGDITLSLGTNAVGPSALKGSSGALTNGGGNGYVLQSNGDGTFSWMNISSGVAADPSSLALGTGQFYIGDASSKASAISKSGIPLSGFGVPTADVSMGTKKIISLGDPSDPQDAATKNYVDTHMPASLVGAVVYKGTYDASAGTIVASGSTLPAAGSTNLGNYYVVNTAGSKPIALNVGDWVISDGTSWSRVANGNITYTTDQVPETATPTNKYYTEARVNANSTVVALGTNKEDKSNKATAIVTETTNTSYPSVQAVKNYVDARIPTYSSSNNGQVLTVVSGLPTWQTIAGGGTVTKVSVVDNNNGITGTVANDATTPAITLTLGNIKPTAITTTGTISGGAINGTTVAATGTVSGSNISATATVSGANTGDQTITLTGPVTGSGKGTFATTISDNTITTANIVNKTITYSDIADATITPAQMNIAGTASVGSVPAYDASGGFTWGTGGATNLTYLATSTGATLASSTGNTVPIGLVDGSNSGLMKPTDYTKLSGLSNYTLPIASSGTLGGVKIGTGLAIDGTGVLTASNTGTITSVATNDGLSGGTINSGAVTLGITNAGIAYSKIATLASGSILGNNGSGNAALTSTQLKTMLGLSNVENTALSTWAGSSNLSTVGTITSGTWNGGTIPIANGGTGATTATAAITALLPAQSGNSGRVLQTNGTSASWATVGGGDMLLGTAQSVTALKTFDNSMLAIKGSSTGVTTIVSTNTTSNPYTITLPAETGTVAMRSSSLSQFAPTTSTELAGIISDEVGTGKLVFNTSPTFITPTLGVASATSVAATGTLTGTQLVSTIANGTAPLVVTSTTPVTNLSIGGNAATATTATTAANLAGGVAGDLFYQSAAGTTAKLNKGAAGQVLTMNPGATAPIWATPSAGGSSITGFTYAYSSGTTASLTIAGSTNYTATVPVLTSANTTDAAGLMVQADRTKLSYFPTMSGSPTTAGQVLTFQGGTGQWIQPGLTYSGTTGTGTVSINNGSSSAVIPVSTSSVSGLMIPTDKAKLDTYPTVSNTPTTGQVLTATGTTTASWQTASSGSGGAATRSYYYALDASTGLDNTDVIARGTGSKLKINMDASTFTITLTIPADALVDYVKINIPPSSFLTAIQGDQDVYLVVKDLGGIWNQSAITMLLPQVNFWPLSGSKTIASSYAYENAAGLNFKVMSCTGGELKTYLDFIEVREGSSYSNGFAMLLQW